MESWFKTNGNLQEDFKKEVNNRFAELEKAEQERSITKSTLEQQKSTLEQQNNGLVEELDKLIKNIKNLTKNMKNLAKKTHLKKN